MGQVIHNFFEVFFGSMLDQFQCGADVLTSFNDLVTGVVMSSFFIYFWSSYFLFHMLGNFGAWPIILVNEDL